MTAYRILLADLLLAQAAADPAMRLVFPQGCRPLRQTDDPAPAGMHWHLFEDPEAPADLEGREVELALGRDDAGRAVIRTRRVIRVHAAPGEDDEAFPCCGLPFDDLPRHDRVTGDPDEVTCRVVTAVPGGDAG